MQNLTEVKIQEIMAPLHAVEFDARFRECPDCEGMRTSCASCSNNGTEGGQEDGNYCADCDCAELLLQAGKVPGFDRLEVCGTCDGGGIVPQAEPEDGGEAGL